MFVVWAPKEMLPRKRSLSNACSGVGGVGWYTLLRGRLTKRGGQGGLGPEGGGYDIGGDEESHQGVKAS